MEVSEWFFNPTIANAESGIDLLKLRELGTGSGLGESYGYSTNLSRTSIVSSTRDYNFTPYPLSIGVDQYIAISGATGSLANYEGIPYYSLYKLSPNGNFKRIFNNVTDLLGYYGGNSFHSPSPFNARYLTDTNIVVFSPYDLSESPTMLWVDYYLDLSKLTPHEGYFSINYSGTISRSGTNIDLSLSSNLQGITPKVITLRRSTRDICTWEYNGESLQGEFSPKINNLMIYTDRRVELGPDNNSGNVLYGTMDSDINSKNFIIFDSSGPITRIDLKDITINASSNIYRIRPESGGNSNLTNVSISGRYCDVTFYTWQPPYNLL